MPTRIRSNGMSIALVLNQLASTTLAGIFLPFVSKHGYSSIFFLFASFTVLYFIVAAFFCLRPKAKRWKRLKLILKGKANAFLRLLWSSPILDAFPPRRTAREG
jgi:SP family myo-inositol transporter-like MFS transporter 13